MKETHLTDEQFFDLIGGGAVGVDATVHLQCCAVCQAELRNVSSGIESFNNLGMSWAERNAPTLVPVPSRWSIALHSVPRWSMAAAALVLVGSAVGSYKVQHRPLVPFNTAAVETAAAPTSNELAEDNQLMISINQELTSEVRPQVPASELQVRGTSRRGSARRFED